MQNAALADLGLGEAWSYEAIDVDPDDFDSRVRALQDSGFAGVNVTVPHKEAALRLADVAGRAANAIGAANTLVFEGSAIRAENTDAPGLINAVGGVAKGLPTLVFGAGGAARAALWAMLGAGADVSVWNRTAARAEALVAAIGGSSEPAPEVSGFELIINASAAGLGRGDALVDLPLEESDFRPGQTVVDMVYGERPSRLLEAAQRAGAATVDGLEVLVRQGALSLEIWTGRRPSLDVMRAAARG